MYAKAVSYVSLTRLIPTACWVGGSVLAGLSVAARVAGWSALDYTNVGLVVLGGICCHGILSHSLNDLADWTSGTDKRSPGYFSGGSRVLPEGKLSITEVQMAGLAGLFFGLILLGILYLRIGVAALIFSGIGIMAAVSYSCHPFSFCYSPLVGEWFAAVPALYAASVLAATSALGGQVPAPSELALSVIVACSLISHLMFHHLSDVDADLSASPQKLTTPAYLQFRWGCPSKYVPGTYFLLSLSASLFFGLWFLALANAAGLYFSLASNVYEQRKFAFLDKALLLFLTLTILIQSFY